MFETAQLASQISLMFPFSLFPLLFSSHVVHTQKMDLVSSPGHYLLCAEEQEGRLQSTVQGLRVFFL